MQQLTSLDEDEEMFTEDDLLDVPSSLLCEPPSKLSPAQTICTTRMEPSFQSFGLPRLPLIEPAWGSLALSPSSSSPLVEPPWDSISTCLSDSTPLLELAWDKSPPPVAPVPSPTTFTLPCGNFPGPCQPMDLSDTPASFSSTLIPLARSPSPVPIPLSHLELLAVSQEFTIQLGVDTPQTESKHVYQFKCQGRSPVSWLGVGYYANTLVDATGEWQSHVEWHAMLTRFWQQLADLLEEELAVYWKTPPRPKVCPGTSGHVPGLCRFIGPGTDWISHIAIHSNAITWDVPRLPWVTGVPTPESAA
ncbi:hypothetical protein F5J12DRAFT_783003 [Pisolithus orientalis]|uniref:uncharacterized protein n=1 Tax=Pisolithus orientalis TaxID=936130 RepID=UPI002224B5D6|nr:uncharacterized protein F5J12DRAFT_783003 [Pisolithus orientalis]KAI6006224.1 hypothetical protein F5J12DRAFT_783003 [Pisolithus orientalis]